jgi:hypothetical protein
LSLKIIKSSKSLKDRIIGIEIKWSHRS